MAATATQADLAAASASLASYRAATVDLRYRLSGLIERVWRGLGSYRNPQIPRFLDVVLPTVQAAEQQMADLTAVYLAQQRQYMLGSSARLPSVDPTSVTGAATRNGVSPAEVYERPFHDVWRDLSNGVDVDKAIENGLKAATSSAVTDLQRTKTLTSQAVLSDDREVTGYRRVLEGDYSCGLCVVASTQRYIKGDLMPCHPKCDCSVSPLYGGQSRIIDLPRLQDVHAAIEATFGASSPAARVIPGAYADGKPINYRDVLVTHTHGELGPILTVRGHAFLGPNDLS